MKPDSNWMLLLKIHLQKSTVCCCFLHIRFISIIGLITNAPARKGVKLEAPERRNERERERKRTVSTSTMC